MNFNVEKIKVKCKNQTYIAFLTIGIFTNTTDLYERVFPFFHPEELELFNHMKYDKKKRDYSMGRYCAKLAIMEYDKQQMSDKICIRNGYLHQPIVYYEGSLKLQVSITHCDNIGMATAFFEDCPLGIDIEKILEENVSNIARQFTSGEKDLQKNSAYKEKVITTIFWTAKEALSKVLKIGFTSSLSVFEIKEVQAYQNKTICTFAHFPQFQSVSYQLEDYMFSMVYPTNAEIDLDIKQIKNVVISKDICENKKN